MLIKYINKLYVKVTISGRIANLTLKLELVPSYWVQRFLLSWDLYFAIWQLEFGTLLLYILQPYR